MKNAKLKKPPMKKEQMTREDMYALLPELKLVKNNALRETCADVWIDALDAGGWFKKAGWGNFPFSAVMRPDCPENLLTHTGLVTVASLGVYDAMAEVRKRVGDCDRDLIAAGALLHDVGKLIEYDFDANGQPCQGRTAKKFRHPVWSFYFTQKHGMAEDLVHLVLTHSMYVSPEGPNAYCTPESWIIKVIDDMCFKYVEMFCGANAKEK